MHYASHVLVTGPAVLQVETAGDAYIVSSGVLVQDGEGFSCVDQGADPQACAQRMMGFARDMLRAAHEVRREGCGAGGQRRGAGRPVWLLSSC